MSAAEITKIVETEVKKRLVAEREMEEKVRKEKEFREFLERMEEDDDDDDEDYEHEDLTAETNREKVCTCLLFCPVLRISSFSINSSLCLVLPNPISQGDEYGFEFKDELRIKEESLKVMDKLNEVLLSRSWHCASKNTYGMMKRIWIRGRLSSVSNQSFDLDLRIFHQKRSVGWLRCVY